MKKKQSSKGKRGEYKTKDFIAESFGQASSYLGIPISLLRWAKKRGCMAFRHGKIHCKEVEPWLETNQPDISGKHLPPKEDVQVLNLMEDLKAKRNKNALFLSEYVKKSKVSAQVIQIGIHQRDILLNSLRNELPPQLEGLRAAEMVPILTEMATRIMDLWRHIDLKKPAQSGK